MIAYAAALIAAGFLITFGMWIGWWVGRAINDRFDL